jgi:hypothetical protein
LCTPGAALPSAPRADERTELERAFAQQDIFLDLTHELCAIPVRITIRSDLLEYVLVNVHGAAHESLFVTHVVPSRLNAAFLALGVLPGRNAAWIAKDPPPTSDEIRAGVPLHSVELPRGDGFHLYVAWRSGEEDYLYRLEDLIRNLATGRSMRRHKWVYLGSRMVRLEPGTPEETFAADVEGNLVNLAFFEQGNTLLSGALPECLEQTIWVPNAWLLPAAETTVQLVFSRQILSALPPALQLRVPRVEESQAGDGR